MAMVKICTSFRPSVNAVKHESYIDMQIENLLRTLAWDENLTAVKAEHENMKNFFKLHYEMCRKKSWY